MKTSKIKIYHFLCLFASILFFSCEKIEATKTDNNTKILNPRWRIYHAEWDEWGRKSKNCGSWGLCNFHDCWFCDPYLQGRGEIQLEETPLGQPTGIGLLYIELDTLIAVQNSAIINQDTLFIDEDITILSEVITEFDTITAKSGFYLFQTNIGPSGGYVVDLICN